MNDVGHSKVLGRDPTLGTEYHIAALNERDRERTKESNEISIEPLIERTNRVSLDVRIQSSRACTRSPIRCHLFCESLLYRSVAECCLLLCAFRAGIQNLVSRIVDISSIPGNLLQN